MSDDREPGSDPTSRMLGAATDFWTKGLDTWLSAAGGADAGRYEPLGMNTGASGPAADMAQAMGRAWMVVMSSASRYGRGITEIHTKYNDAVTQAMGDRVSGQAAAPIQDCRVLADELRALLREIGDTATLEARRLRIELEAVGEEVARAADAATPTPSGSDPQPRRYRVKP